MIDILNHLLIDYPNITFYGVYGYWIFIFYCFFAIIGCITTIKFLIKLLKKLDVNVATCDGGSK